MLKSFVKHNNYLLLYYFLHNRPLLSVSTDLIKGLLEGNKGIAVDSVFAYSSIHFPLPPYRNLICVLLPDKPLEADSQLQKWDLEI